MTEDDRPPANDPQAMPPPLRAEGMLSERQAGLLGAACCRQVWHLFHAGGPR
jgi:hypothetical protein